MNANVRKWKWIYFSLAALDLAAIGTSLIFNREFSHQYNQALQINEFWSDRLEDVEELQRQVSEVNAPGNDIFDSEDISKESLRLETSAKELRRVYQRLSADIRRKDFTAASDTLIPTLEGVEPLFEAVIQETGHIFEEFRRHNKSNASRQMAAMDQTTARLRSLLTKLSSGIREIQSHNFRQQKDVGERLHYFELFLSFSILLMVIGIGFYGSQLSRFVAEALEDKNLLEEQMAALNASAIVAVTDPNGVIKHVNQKFEEISGFSENELLGKTHRVINSGHHPKEFFKDMWTTLLQGRVWRGEVKNRKKNGEFYWVDSTVVPMKNASGTIWQFVAIRFDVTRRKEVEAERLLLEKELISAKENAEAATRVKASFLANMSHEIRTPLNGIIGIVNLLINTVKSNEILEKLIIVQSSANALLDLINDLLDFSKLEANKLEIESIPVALSSLVNDVLELSNVKASEKGITISYSAEASVPLWIKGDPLRIRQVLSNLIGNAIKFTQMGNVRITSKIRSETGEKILMQFSVSDTGVGIPKDLQSRLFQSFSQVDASTTRKFGGSGLGLAICKGLCERMGGEIWFESEEGKGATFYFTFQAERSNVVETRSMPEIDPLMGKKNPLSILVAEDNRTNQIVAVGLLGRLGYRADVANNGREALERLALRDYDLIFMDCHMPELDGFETTKKICEMGLGERQPIIVALTASTMKEDIDKCFHSGMDGFLAKPITLTVLLKKLEEITNMVKRRAA